MNGITALLNSLPPLQRCRDDAQCHADGSWCQLTGMAAGNNNGIVNVTSPLHRRLRAVARALFLFRHLRSGFITETNPATMWV